MYHIQLSVAYTNLCLIDIHIECRGISEWSGRYIEVMEQRIRQYASERVMLFPQEFYCCCYIVYRAGD